MTTAAAFWLRLEAAERARIEAVRIKATGNHRCAQNDEPEPEPTKAPRTKLRARNLNMTEREK